MSEQSCCHHEDQASSGGNRKPAKRRAMEGSSSNSNNNTTTGTGDITACLHCAKSSPDNMQVRCDLCSSYICSDCHWCPAFPGNHEIRVCDRCDTFCCQACDEMDHCDDCGEVVCSACANLLSCKFCGGGLCDECATACGRCGIVLCSRDAKFAVECDTCRLSYCLVCLASGSKESCVRCNHRPSKRMEQLVHLRLKSIYKAFKQSSEGVNALATAVSGGSLNENGVPGSSDDAEALLRAAAAASAQSPSSRDTPVSGGQGGANTEQNVSVEEYMKSARRADAAAKALIAELEEEEQKEQTKKSKKKKKKKEKQKEKTSELEEQEKVIEEHSLKETSKSFETTDSVAVEHALPEATQTRVDPDEVKFEKALEADDIDGLEEILSSIKGVPGRGVLRKSVKKALKRLKTPEEEDDDERLMDRNTPPLSEENAISDILVSTHEDPRVSELLQAVSYTNNALSGAQRTKIPNPKGNSECILHMSPNIVGWVIGKGGQRIRELMEESGARVWIDQNSMKPDDPRVVYVSGNQANVATAIQMIKDLIAKAPTAPTTETPKSLRSTPSRDTSTSNPVSSRPEKDVIHPAGSPKGLPNQSKSPETSKVKHEMVCDPRFVPLLIGRRGWTIKNIQDSSGARIDIDQTVTPRQITISGKKTGVEIAKGMVEDVLSYPQSQLHRLGGKEENNPVTDTQKEAPQQKKEEPLQKEASLKRIAVDNFMEVQRQSMQQRDFSTATPPTTEVLAGDGKEVVSASSSLSTTPEPAHAVKALNQVIGSGVFLSPVAQSSSLVTPVVGGERLVTGSNPFSQEARALPQATSQTLFPSQNVQGGSSGGLLHANPAALHHKPSLAPYDAPHVLVGPPPTQPGYGGDHHQGRAFRMPVPEGLTGFDRSLDNFSRQTEGVPPPVAQSNNEFALAAAVDFLQHNRSRSQKPVDHQPMSGSTRPFLTQRNLAPMSQVQPVQQDTLFSAPGPRYESNVVDSLFGLPQPASEDAALVAGLNGLGLGSSREGEPFWGNGLQGNMGGFKQ